MKNTYGDALKVGIGAAIGFIACILLSSNEAYVYEPAIDSRVQRIVTDGQIWCLTVHDEAPVAEPWILIRHNLRVAETHEYTASSPEGLEQYYQSFCPDLEDD